MGSLDVSGWEARPGCYSGSWAVAGAARGSRGGAPWRGWKVRTPGDAAGRLPGPGGRGLDTQGEGGRVGPLTLRPELEAPPRGAATPHCRPRLVLPFPGSRSPLGLRLLGLTYPFLVLLTSELP